VQQAVAAQRLEVARVEVLGLAKRTVEQSHIRQGERPRGFALAASLAGLGRHAGQQRRGSNGPQQASPVIEVVREIF
jgi:hypothetical protein